MYSLSEWHHCSAIESAVGRSGRLPDGNTREVRQPEGISQIVSEFARRRRTPEDYTPAMGTLVEGKTFRDGAGIIRWRLICVAVCLSVMLLPKPAAAQDAGRPDKLFFTNVSGSVSTSDDLTVTRWQLSGMTMLPVQPPQKMLMVRPSFEYTQISADALFDTPEDLYRLGLNFMWLQKLNDRWSLSLALNPSLNADSHSFGDSVRLFGLAGLKWDWKPDRLSLTFGAVHTGRSDIPVLPAAGFRWTPNERWDVNIMMPRPKVSYRLTSEGESSSWIYWAGALGGGTWDVLRTDGTTEEFSLREFQTVAGYEYRFTKHQNLFAEVGAAFGRRLEYEESGIEQSMSESLFVRCGVSF